MNKRARRERQQRRIRHREELETQKQADIRVAAVAALMLTDDGKGGYKELKRYRRGEELISKFRENMHLLGYWQDYKGTWRKFRSQKQAEMVQGAKKKSSYV